MARSGSASRFLSERIELGLGLTYTQLRQTTRRDYNEAGEFTGGFLGSIDRLHVEQSCVLAPLLRVKWNEHVGIQIGYTAFGAKTATFWDGHSDGSFRLSGPTFELYARSKSASDFSPYAAVGVAVLSAGFRHDELWHNGFSPRNPQAYRDWVAEGRPTWPNNGYRRTIVAEDAVAVLLSGGCMYRMTDKWLIDFSARYMKVDIDANYYLSSYGSITQDRGVYSIPMSNVSLTLSLVYDF
jgi:hypothetical protein